MTSNISSTTPDTSLNRQPSRWRVASVGVSAALCLFLIVSYATRLDLLAAITIFPVWLWLVSGLFLTTFGWKRRAPLRWKRVVVGVAALWLVLLLVFAEEPWSLARPLWQRSGPMSEWEKAREQGRALRVATLNCGGGLPQAAAEVARFQPDLVLLQESPGREEVEKLARRMFGHNAGVLVGPDASIIVRGVLHPSPSPRTHFFVRARARFDSGLEAEIVSLRLMTPPFRADLWSPACHAAYRDIRRVQRDQLRLVLDELDAVPDEIPLILGGDFNTPQGDAIFHALRPRLRDSFAAGGVGWGNTIINEAPFLRIDQVWASRHFRAANVRAHATKYSDHRLVVCDLRLDAGRTRP